MAVDKLVDSTQLDADLTSVANAIRTKGGTSSQLAFPAGFVSAVQAIPTGVTPTGTKQISITENGTTTEDVTNYASAQITANVPNTYSAGDEGKVVSDGALVAQTSRNIDTNGTYDTTTNNEVVVNVSGGGGDTLEWKASRAAFQGFGGIFGGKNLNYDLDNKVATMAQMNYFAMADGPNGKLTFKNVSSSLTGAQMNSSDFLRQSPTFKEIDFGGLAPTAWTRWFNQWSYSANGKSATAPITVRNLNLDNLTSANTAFQAPNTSSQYYHGFDAYFTGELKNSINLSGCTMFNADSWNRLIECLYDYSEGDAHTLTVGSTILAMIDATHQAMAAARGWTLA